MFERMIPGTEPVAEFRRLTGQGERLPSLVEAQHANAEPFDESYGYGKGQTPDFKRKPLGELWAHLGKAISSMVGHKVLSHSEGMALGKMIAEYLMKLR